MQDLTPRIDNSNEARVHIDQLIRKQGEEGYRKRTSQILDVLRQHELALVVDGIRDYSIKSIIGPHSVAYYSTGKYFGKLDVSECEDGRIRLFKDGEYLILDRGRNSLSLEKGILLSAPHIGIRKPDSVEDLKYDIFNRNYEEVNRGLHATDIYVNPEDPKILVDYASSLCGLTTVHSFIKRLGLQVDAELDKKAREEARKDFISVYNLFNRKERAGHWGDGNRAAVDEALGRLKDGNAERLLPEVISPNPGVAINVKKFIEHVEMDISRSKASKVRR